MYLSQYHSVTHVSLISVAVTVIQVLKIGLVLKTAARLLRSSRSGDADWVHRVLRPTGSNDADWMNSLLKSSSSIAADWLHLVVPLLIMV